MKTNITARSAISVAATGYPGTPVGVCCAGCVVVVDVEGEVVVPCVVEVSVVVVDVVEVSVVVVDVGLTFPVFNASRSATYVGEFGSMLYWAPKFVPVTISVLS